MSILELAALASSDSAKRDVEDFSEFQRRWNKWAEQRMNEQAEEIKRLEAKIQAIEFPLQ